MKWLLPAILVLLLSFCVTTCGDSDDDDDDDGGASYSACDSYGSAMFLGSLENENLGEASGLAASERNPGVIWLNNDSGHGPVVYAIDQNRQTLGRLILDGITQTDWEDIAVGPCPEGRCIFVGDIGDNEQTRDSIRVYVFPEPKLSGTDAFGDRLITDFRTLTLAYQDKPHDCEGLAVTSAGQIYLFSKEAEISNLFRVPDAKSSDTQTLLYVGHFSQTDKVTGADIHPNGQRLLLRTRDRIYEFRAEAKASFDSIINATRTAIPSGNDRQGEAIGYDPQTGHIFHATESADGDYSQLYEIPCG